MNRFPPYTADPHALNGKPPRRPQVRLCPLRTAALGLFCGLIGFAFAYTFGGVGFIAAAMSAAALGVLGGPWCTKGGDR